ncbi:hypothetical protein [Nocardia rhizosphaerihabitans]|uniref:Uncharacterized protein n=1 Tax=Nocardia rhizosphaerihabitans TaxID=1691570 RepID=A0ABQ2KJ45_9NOCA|nr:hypothetical protein [Nocardia rhizosphaerihabitans]GGN81059.1 hypothetical protein GCM10011610_31050 [Nocardia rhizosphaerihabitans]
MLRELDLGLDAIAAILDRQTDRGQEPVAGRSEHQTPESAATAAADDEQLRGS